MPAAGAIPDTLNALRRTIASSERLDAVCGRRGLAFGALHEIFPRAPVHFGAVFGFALARALAAAAGALALL